MVRKGGTLCFAILLAAFGGCAGRTSVYYEYPFENEYYYMNPYGYPYPYAPSYYEKERREREEHERTERGEENREREEREGHGEERR